MPKQTVVMGTRTSTLALWQTHHIKQRLQAKWPDLECSIQTFVTKGDKSLDKPLPQIGGKGLFTAELERALEQGEIDIAVHSLKDLPVEQPPGLTVGAISSRAAVQDVLVAREGWTWETLPPGAVVGTSSNRRRAQLLAERPDLQVKSIRGNVETRVSKVMSGQYDAVVLAKAGLVRLDMTAVITDTLPLEQMLPAPGQGALAVQCRADDVETWALLAVIHEPDVAAAVTTERHFLSQLGGGCAAPIAAYATVDEEGLHLRGLIGSPDGQHIIRVAGGGRDPLVVGTRLAQEAVRQGAKAILTGIHAAGEALPLAGKRIVITRALAQGRSFYDQLVQLGADPLLLPAIQIEPMADMGPLDKAIDALSQYAWVIFTSVNGVRIFGQRLQELGQDATLLAGVKVAAVGASTAGALQQAGIAVDFVPDVYVAEALAQGIGDVRGQRILLPVAAASRPTLTQMLTAQTAQVTRIDIYQTIPAVLTAETLQVLAQGVDIITFTSSSTVKNFVAAVKAVENGRFLPYLQQAQIACIGPVTAQTAREAGLQVAVLAHPHTMTGLAEALVQHFQV